MGRPARKDVRRRLLEAASETFLARGYLDSTLDDIARRAGLSKGAVYSNFTSKQEIFEVLLNSRIERMRTVMAAATSPAPATVPGRRASVVIAGKMIAGARWSQLVLEFASRAGRDEEVREIYLPFLRAQQDIIMHTLLHDLDRAPAPDDDSARLIAVILVALYNGLTLAHAGDPDRISEELMEEALGTVITALVINPADRPSP